MKKLINAPADVLTESLRGVQAAPGPRSRDLDALAAEEELDEADHGALHQCCVLDRGQGPLRGASLGILHRAGRQVGEHDQCSFAAYFEPFTP